MNFIQEFWTCNLKKKKNLSHIAEKSAIPEYRHININIYSWTFFTVTVMHNKKTFEV